MTDEEKAEEILQTKGSMTFCAKGCGYTEKVKELIAIGLAEGRKEKWHDLRKNPDDLPEERGGYLILHEDNTGFTHYSVRDFRHGYFECTNTIIAWCELPKFKE